MDVWDDPENENKYLHLLTQLVLGEKVLLLGTQNEWSEIAAVEQLNKSNPLGYSGWVRSEDLVYGWPTSQEFIVVMKPAAYIYTQPDGFPKMSVYLDTRLVMVSSSSGWVQVALPDGEDGWMRIADVRISSNLDESIPTDGLISLAKTFIGASYRWGGTTAAGIDCSGLFYRVFHAYGITLFRDADDLATEGEAVSRNDLEMGDLIFTASKPGGPVVHVAMYLGGEYILDATEYYGVYMRSIQEFLYDNPWVNAQRFIP